MEWLILLAILVFLGIQKILNASVEKKAEERRRRSPLPTSWEDPWGEQGSMTIPNPGNRRGGPLLRPSSSPATDRVQEDFQDVLEDTRDAVKKAKEAREAISQAENRVKTPKKKSRPLVPSPKRKETFKLKGSLFTKENLVRGIMLQEILGPPPSRRSFRRTRR